jgi:hypothetical protein
VGLTGAARAGTTDQAIKSWSVSLVPEPNTLALMISGLILAGFTGSRVKGSRRLDAA